MIKYMPISQLLNVALPNLSKKEKEVTRICHEHHLL